MRVMGASPTEERKEKRVGFLSYFKRGPTIAGNCAEVTMWRTTRLAIAFGIANLVLARWLPGIASKFFTKDASVAASITEIAPYVMCAVALHCPMCVLEGSLFATRDLAFVVVAYIMSGAGFLTYQTYVRNMGLGTSGVWRGMAAYQLWRFCLFLWRVRTNTFKPLLDDARGERKAR
jgi:Na+-driven multidrug efflux pump